MTAGVVFAKGGSIGVPNKMLQEICGKPMVEWVIRAVIESGCDEYFLSTEDPEIMAVGSFYGLTEVWRPPELARPETQPWEYWNDFIERFTSGDVILIAQGASPLMRAADYFYATGRFACMQKEEDPPGAMIPIAETIPLAWQGHVDHMGVVDWKSPGVALRRQDQGGTTFRRCGSGWVGERDYLLANKLGHGDRTAAWFCEKEHSLDVDDSVDLELARILMKRRLESEAKSTRRPHNGLRSDFRCDLAD